MEEIDRLHNILGDISSIKDAYFDDSGSMVDSGSPFSSGIGYIQHDPEIVEKFAIAICEKAKTYFKSGDYDKHFDYRPVNRYGFIGRLLDDCSSSNKEFAKLSKYWSRLMCIDTEGREWGQPYFAMHKDGTKNCLNKYFRDERLNTILNEG